MGEGLWPERRAPIESSSSSHAAQRCATLSAGSAARHWPLKSLCTHRKDEVLQRPLGKLADGEAALLDHPPASAVHEGLNFKLCDQAFPPLPPPLLPARSSCARHHQGFLPSPGLRPQPDAAPHHLHPGCLYQGPAGPPSCPPAPPPPPEHLPAPPPTRTPARPPPPPHPTPPPTHRIMSTMKQTMATTRPNFPIAVASQPSFSCRRGGGRDNGSSCTVAAPGPAGPSL